MPDSERSQESITFGVELEFLVPLPPAPSRAQLEHESHRYCKSLGRLSICNTLCKHAQIPVAAECHHLPVQSCAVCESITSSEDQIIFGQASVFNVITRKNIERIPGMSDRTDYFHVDFECLSTSADCEGEWLGLEVRTAAFTERELRLGLPKLASCVDALATGNHDIKVNDSCGMHIHVGLTSGMTLLIAKKLVTLVMLIEEPLLRALIPDHRRQKRAAAPVATVSRLARGVELPQEVATESLQERELTAQMRAHLPSLNRLPLIEHRPDNIRRTLIRLWQLRSLYELEDVLCDAFSLRCGLGFCLRDEEGKVVRPINDAERHAWVERARSQHAREHSPSSVEFRYPDMTFDVQSMAAWVEIVEKVMSIARWEEEKYQELLRDLIVDLDEEGEVWERLLTRLGLVEKISYCKKRKEQ